VHAPDLPELAPRLLGLGLTLVIDHMGRMSAGRGVEDPGFQQLCRWLAEGRVWTKISGADRNTMDGPPYADIDVFAKALLAANPERVVWGSDWPHINYYEPSQVPDDGELLNRLFCWLPDTALRKRVLVDNPATLYGFASAPLR
jgi:2-pyrone-4,6-dicarboxylate lactonase